MLKKLEEYKSELYVVFRVLVGLLFAQHGAQKLGLLGGSVMGGVMVFVGVCELLGGLAVALGVFTRLAALLGAVLTLIIYFKAHAFNALLPIMNRGELALVYFAAFLVIAAKGAKKASLEKKLLKKEFF